MLRRNVDFIAVFLIAVFMIGFSQAASWNVSDVVDTVRLQNAVNAKTNTDTCPISREILSRIAYFLNQ